MDWYGLISTTIYSILGLAAIGGFLWFALYYRKFNIVVILRDLTNGKSVIKVDKGRVYESDGGYMKLMHDRGEVPLPDPSVIDIKSNGQRFVEIVKHGSGTFNYTAVHFNNDKYLSGDALKKHDFEMISNGSRQFHVAQMRRAEEMRKRGIGAMIAAAAPFIMIFILAIAGYLVYDSIGERMGVVADSNRAAMDSAAKITEQQAKITTSLENIILNKQTISSENPPKAPN